MNPDTIECVWTGEFDLNTLRVNGEMFESGKKKLRIPKYPDTCGRGLSYFSDCNQCCDWSIYRRGLKMIGTCNCLIIGI